LNLFLYLQSEDYPVQMTYLYGDGAARELGYEPLGLSDRAGLALALHDGKRGLGETAVFPYSSVL